MQTCLGSLIELRDREASGEYPPFIAISDRRLASSVWFASGMTKRRSCAKHRFNTYLVTVECAGIEPRTRNQKRLLQEAARNFARLFCSHLFMTNQSFTILFKTLQDNVENRVTG